MSRQSSSLSLEDAKKALRAANLRCTSCRIAVLQHLANAKQPVSHADVSDELVPLGYDKSTIYRCLIELAEANMVARLDLGDHIWRFEMLGDNAEHASDHPHFVCLDCGKVSCLPDVKVKITSTHRASGADITEVLLKGHCVDCQ